MTTTEEMFDLPKRADESIYWREGDKRDYIDNELIDHEFKHELRRTWNKNIPQELTNFAEDFDDLVSLGADKSQLQSLVRQAYILADIGGECIRALFERLDYKEGVVEHHHYRVAEAERAAELRTLDGLVRVEIDDRLDPHGYYVYILWGESEAVYVGQSTNILSRLGSHMQDTEKRTATKTIQLIRCDDRDKMMETEIALIGKHRPRWNIRGNSTYRSPRSNGDGSSVLV